MFSEIIYINLTKQKKIFKAFKHKPNTYKWFHRKKCIIPKNFNTQATPKQLTIPQCPSNGWINYAKLFSKQRMTTFYDFLEMQMWVPEYINIVVEDFVALFVTMHTT